MLLAGLLGLLAFSSHVSSQKETDVLNLHLTSGGFENYLWRSNITAAQILLTSSNVTDRLQRFVVAMPAGNSGALSYFLPVDETQELSVQLVNGTLQDAVAPFNNVGVQGKLSFNADASLGVTIIGAVRAMRDYVEGSGTMHEIFNYTVSSFNASFLHLHRGWINSTHSMDFILTAQDNMMFNITPSNNGTFTPPTVLFQLPDPSRIGTVGWSVVCNETTFAGLGPSGVFLSPSEAANQAGANALQGLANGANVNAQQLSFLTYQSKSLAGGWRFLTYFGRDTMIALRLLMPIVTPEESESVLGAVLERLNSTGAACHEETIGDYASFINLSDGIPELGDTPFYDYKMIDTDLYVLPTVAHYFLDIPQGKNRSSAFLSQRASLNNTNLNISFHDLLVRNALYNLQRAEPFALNPHASNLLHLRPGQPVGNWRDSNEGLGYGTIPFDVNVALVPSSLRALARLSRAGLLQLPNVTAIADAYAQIWEDRAASFFDVKVNATTAESRLKDFVIQANLSEALLDAAEKQSNRTIQDSVEFYALSLHDDGSQVDVMHSDLGFSLLFASNVPKQQIEHAITLLQPYPIGLLTNLGMLSTNPALSSNRTQIDVLDRGSYHGTVVWSFQQALMAAGIARQLKFCDNSTITIDIEPIPNPKPSWCSEKALVSDLKAAQSRLWNSINGGRAEIFSEVWSYSYDKTQNTFDVADLAVISPQGTESDAIQFWSFTFLAVANATMQN
ncbi:hypothetical protein M422DRAFT_271225 [Sphaerobolus stellatus SS14]|uniref:Uncharacterized protein n=1 Tax=Sphaerobolus stellatus (strain SS14) TaxID=990650 RepID=A0A0C9UQD5_SPHS4|nr:hypothetical protein M422DRAFT_271225 [Sphaerobolus stellatus SS14]